MWLTSSWNFESDCRFSSLFYVSTLPQLLILISTFNVIPSAELKHEPLNTNSYMHTVSQVAGYFADAPS